MDKYCRYKENYLNLKMASRNIPLKFSTMRDGIELFKAQESYKGSNLELYIDTQYLIESKEKRIKSLDEDDRDELFALWVQKGYIDHNYAGIKKTFR